MEHLHSEDIIHGDIQPSNIMFFSASRSWKLLDTDFSVKKGLPCAIHYTPLYASPEVIHAAVEGQSSITLEPSADMWSFGIVAFEVLTGTELILLCPDWSWL